MANFWRGAAEVGNVLYDYQGDKRKWELMDTQNALQKMKMEALQEEVAGRKAESEALKGVSAYNTTTTEMPEYQGVVTPPDPNEGYSAPPESALMRQTTTQTPKPSYQYKRDIAQALASRGQVKAANLYFDDAAKDEQTVHTNLWNSLKFAVEKGDDNVSNGILENAPESFFQATGMKRGMKFTDGGQAYKMTVRPSAEKPFRMPDGSIVDKGILEVKVDRRGNVIEAIDKEKEMTLGEELRLGMERERLDEYKRRGMEKKSGDDKDAKKAVIQQRKDAISQINKYNADVKQARSAWVKSQSSDVPQTNDDWSATLQDIYDRYEPTFQDLGVTWGKSSGGGEKKPVETPAPSPKANKKQVDVVKPDGTKISDSEVSGHYNKIQIKLGRVPSATEFNDYLTNQGLKANFR